MLRPGIKLIALVSILGISAYLLFIPGSTEPLWVQARQGNSTMVPRAALSSPSVEPTAAARMAVLPSVSTSTAVTNIELLAGLPAALEKATPEQRSTADQLLNFISTGNMGNIRDLTREQIQSLAGLLEGEIGGDAIAAAVESYFGLPASSFLSYGNPTEAIADLFEAVQSETNSVTAGSVVFSDQVQADGTVTGNVHVIPAGTKRVYAAFENTGGLHGMDQLLAIWRKPSDDRMVFTEYEPVRIGSTYNYVWLELDDGWPLGFYQLDLFNPSKPSELLASRSFNVR